MSFAAPLWLLAALGLLVPLVLHLLARGRGRRVRVGSVRLLSASPPRRPRRLQLQRPLLLALRCALLALMTLALAGPRLRREADTVAEPRPWVLLDPSVASRTAMGSPAARASALPPGVRQAIAAEAEVRLLAPGLPPATAVGDTTALPDVAAVPGGLWSLLREAATTAPAGTRLVVVSDGRLAALRGERPALAKAIEWHELPDRRSNRWPERVFVAADGSTLLVGESDSARTSFARRPLASSPSAVALPGRDAVAADDRLPLSAPRPVEVAVLAAPDRAGDARYLRAAVAAASEAAGVVVDVLPRAGAAEAAALAAVAVDGAPRIVFWLGEASPPPAVLSAVRAGTWLIADGAGREETCLGSFVAVASTAPIAVRRCAASARGPRVLWRSDTGRALLVEETLGRGRWLRFGSRFHPAWSDLVLSPALPEWLRDVLLAAAAVDGSRELPISDRRAGAGQGRPARAAAQRRVDAPPPPPSPVPEHAAWLLVFPLLVAERWLAARR